MASRRAGFGLRRLPRSIWSFNDEEAVRESGGAQVSKGEAKGFCASMN